MIHIVYISRAVVPLTEKNALENLERFRARNQENAITGVLLYQGGYFIQLLEGEEAAVRETYARIRKDVRHTSVFTLIDEPIESREFDDWSMAFRDLDVAPIETHEDFGDFLVACTSPEAMFQTQSRVRQFLNCFKELTKRHPECFYGDGLTTQHSREEQRLQALCEYGLLDCPPDDAFQHVLQFLRDSLNVETSGISVVDRDHVWLKSFDGRAAKKVERHLAFCSHTICNDRPVVVEDLASDARFLTNPLVSGAFENQRPLRFYAGFPLNGMLGFNIGALYAIDDKPRSLTNLEFRLMEILAGLIINEFDFRLTKRRLHREHQYFLKAGRVAGFGKLASGIAHKINSPLQSISSNTDFLSSSVDTLVQGVRQISEMPVPRGDTLAPLREVAECRQILEAHEFEFLSREIPQALHQTRSELGRVSEIVRHINELSHTNFHVQGEKKLEKLNSAIADVVSVARNLWASHCDLLVDLCDSLPPVFCCLGEINQVILQLLGNASDAIEERIRQTPEPRGCIQVRTALKDGMISLEVEDNGGGIPDRIRHRIFEPFFTTKVHEKASGQGLSLCRDIVVQRHSGRMSLSTDPRAGWTVFRVELPVAKHAEIA